MEPDAESAQKELLAEAAAAVRAEAAEKEKNRPKTVAQGTLGLVGDSLGGVALGAAAIVVGPYAGYKEGGASGILKGAVGGLCVGVASAALGIGSGVVKLMDGAAAATSDKNLPAIEPNHVADSAEEDRTTYEREKADLYEGLLHDSAAPDVDAGAMPPPKNTELYDVLGVQYNANPKQIRKAYYQLATRFHPDKNPDDPTATAKFQKISDAYQVLSDPVKRDEYNRMGEVSESGGLLDPKSLFALMFSNDRFEHIVGDLATSTLLSSQQQENGDSHTPEESRAQDEQRKRFQEARVQKLAALLTKRLEPWVTGDREKFMAHARLEICVLREEPFGVDILHTVGQVYRKKAALMLGKGKGPLGLRGFFSELTDKAQMFRSKAEAIEGGIRAAQSVSEVNVDENEEDVARRQSVTVLGAVWLASVVDIQSTLKAVVLKKVLSEPGVSKEVLRLRAEGLSTLGKMFQQA